MAASTAALPDTQRAQAQRNLVVNYDQVARRVGIKLSDQRLNRDATQVHVGLGLGQNDVPAGDACGGCQCPAAAVVSRHAALLRQPVDSQKTHIVGGELVLDTRVSKANHYGWPLSFLVHFVSQAQSLVTSSRPFQQPDPGSRPCPSSPLPAPPELPRPPHPLSV